MSDETTPLTSSQPPGPMHVFPGGVSPRSRRQKMCQYQFCIGLMLFVILIAGLVLALVLTDNYYLDPQDPVLNLATNNTPITNATIRDILESTTKPIPDEPVAKWALKHLNKTTGEQAIGAGIQALGDREIMEEGMETTPIDSPAFRHYRSLNTNPEARKIARRGYVENQATMRIAQMFNYTKIPGRSNIGIGPRIDLPDPTLNFACDFNERYRRMNGVCNNKLHPRNYGAAMIPYRRMISPDYADGIALPRGSVNGTITASYLPSAREVSLKIYRASYETDSNFTVMLAVFGQFLDHDITATSLTTSQEGESINCCTQPPNTHPECFPVPIAPNDPYYKQFNVSCMNFVRSAPASTGHFGPRQQLNQATAFIDGSVVYGNTDIRQEYLRTMSNGTLRMFITKDGRELLPLSTNFDDGCNRAQMARDGKYCFESGDDRANENLLLTSMHLLFARHHNYLARGLQEANPSWDDETVFQEARKILSAQMQHITYNEFLPILIGRDLAQAKGLLPSTNNLKAPDTYDSSVDPTIANCFASAAFRFAHTLLPGLFNMTRDNSTSEAMELHQMLFNPFSLWKEGGIDSALVAAANTPVQRVDRFFSLEVTQKLFENNVGNKRPICGLDLVSLNLQRGRDHGLPTYTVFRQHCNLPPTDTWEHMAAAVDTDSLQTIKQIYNSPLDVDVYTGALSEPPMEGAIFGPLLTCMVSDQFLRLKMGDSHWYERKIGPQRFTKDQLREIYKTLLSEIICRNSDSLQKIRKYVMEKRKEIPNVYVYCSEMPSFNFSLWVSEPRKLYTANLVSRPMTLVRVMSDKKNTLHQNTITDLPLKAT
ncbi:chorion peroxidase-like [Teleopsis dalmanni]|uniref:chorion peroxidase-like n=1 Tax=Teleopsis dalmanni TaxID=139649 RepID=UPI0018CC8384|nr:chorion peroxidase-like [Teleopsis dalmanni]